MTHKEGRPLNHNYWEPSQQYGVEIEQPCGMAPLLAVAVGHQETIVVNQNGYPTPPNGFLIVEFKDGGWMSLHEQFVRKV